MTRKAVGTITLVGENECTFPAAVGHRLFSFAIYIEDDAGNVVHRNLESLIGESARMFVGYLTMN